jgi:hypothetical protein
MPFINVSHDLTHQILEISSLIRVINNYYFKKQRAQEKIKPLLLKRFREGLNSIIERDNWLLSIPSALNTLSNDFLSKNDSFRFPDSILLFEHWMNLGIEALYPQFILHFKFPGYLKNEKARHIFQFIFATSRGFAFPLYFAPDFYGYRRKFMKYLEPLFEWCYGVCHMANQATFLVDNRLNMKRHHPGEFESVILSEFEDKTGIRFKSIDTLFHGYFTNEPKNLGKFANIEEALNNLTFVYTVGDHAISLKKKKNIPKKEIKYLSNQEIEKEYDLDFYSYIEKLLGLETLLLHKKLYYKKKRKQKVKELSFLQKLKLFLYRSKKLTISKRKLPEEFSEIEKLSHFSRLIEKINELLWTTPLYSHTVHDPNLINRDEFKRLTGLSFDLEDFDKKSSDSIIMSYINQYSKSFNFTFDDEEILDKIRVLRDHMAKMWLYFKERQFKYALRKINQLSEIHLTAKDYKEKITMNLRELIPLISIYELFNRPLSKSVYPESIPQTKRLGAYLAKFLTSKYNILGLNLIRLFNKLAFNNWIYLIQKFNLNLKEFFIFVLSLPIWKHIPEKIKQTILSNTK